MLARLSDFVHLYSVLELFACISNCAFWRFCLYEFQFKLIAFENLVDLVFTLSFALRIAPWIENVSSKNRREILINLVNRFDVTALFWLLWRILRPTLSSFARHVSDFNGCQWLLRNCCKTRRVFFLVHFRRWDFLLKLRFISRT